MGKILKFLSLSIVALVIVFGAGGEVDAKKKKKKIKLTSEENAMFDRWKVKKKKRAKAVKDMRKKPKFVGAVKCNGSCHDPYYQAWKASPHGGTFNLLKPGARKEAKLRVKLDPEKDYLPHHYVYAAIQQVIDKEVDLNLLGLKVKKVKILRAKLILMSLI